MPLLNNDFDGDGRSEIPVISPAALGILDLSGKTLGVPVLAANGTRLGEWLLDNSNNRFESTADLDGDGRSEILVASPWGVGVLKRSGNTMTAIMMAANGTRFGDWLLNTADNRFGPVADFNGDGIPEVLISSPWGVGVLRLSGNTFKVLMMAPNGTRFGGWLLNTADNRFGFAGDIDGDRQFEILVSSPWGVGFLKLAGATFSVPFMAPNGTRFGGWLLNTADNEFGAMADYDGDGRAELLVTSPWGLGILKFSATELTSLVMAANGARIGGWLLNTLDNRFGPAADYKGRGRDQILVVSPWGIGIFEVEGVSLAVHLMFPNGTRLGEWLLNTADSCFDLVGDYDHDGQAEIVVSSPTGIGVLDVSDGGINSCSTVAWTDAKLGRLLSTT